MSDQHRFRNDRPKATGRRESDQGNDHVDQKNEDVAHKRNATRDLRNVGSQADFLIRLHKWKTALSSRRVESDFASGSGLERNDVAAVSAIAIRCNENLDFVARLDHPVAIT